MHRQTCPTNPRCEENATIVWSSSMPYTRLVSGARAVQSLVHFSFSFRMRSRNDFHYFLPREFNNVSISICITECVEFPCGGKSFALPYVTGGKKN